MDAATELLERHEEKQRQQQEQERRRAEDEQAAKQRVRRRYATLLVSDDPNEREELGQIAIDMGKSRDDLAGDERAGRTRAALLAEWVDIPALESTAPDLEEELKKHLVAKLTVILRDMSLSDLRGIVSSDWQHPRLKCWSDPDVRTREQAIRDIYSLLVRKRNEEINAELGRLREAHPDAFGDE